MADDASGSAAIGPRSVDGLDINEVEDGLVIYDGDRDRVHYLNPTAGVVFALCTGEHAEDALAGMVRAVFGTEQPTDGEVEECLAKLRAEGLVA